MDFVKKINDILSKSAKIFLILFQCKKNIVMEHIFCDFFLIHNFNFWNTFFLKSCIHKILWYLFRSDLIHYDSKVYIQLTYFQNRKTFKVLLQSFICQTQVEKAEKWKIWQKSLPGGKLQVWKLCFHVQETWRNWTVFYDKKKRCVNTNVSSVVEF